MKKIAFLAVVFTFAAAAVEGQCNLDMRVAETRAGKRFDVSWARVPGASTYVLEEIEPSPSRRFEFAQTLGGRFSQGFERLTTYDVPVRYRVTALGVGGCTAERSVVYRADASFRRAMVRAVIPLAGSAPGANGAQFRTSLRLRAWNSNFEKGKLVFHPIGVPATPADPSIPYDLSKGPQSWDDVVAAFGATGLGSIDIIPDALPDTGEVRAPRADVRMYNVTAEGTFGTLSPQIQPFSYHADNDAADPALRVTVPGPELRLNMGVRTFLPSKVKVMVYRGETVLAERQLDISSEMLQFTSAAVFTGVDSLRPGDEITVRVHEGAGVPIYSLTDNATNDPALYLPPARVEYAIDRYQVIVD